MKLWPTIKEAVPAQTSEPSLNDLLLEIARFGEPNVVMISSGWYSRIDMNTTALGAKFQVRSEFGHKTPLAAAQECYARAAKAVAALS